MVCKHCGTENDENRNFCSQCGKELGWRCSCGYINKSSDHFCGGCGKEHQITNITYEDSPVPQLSATQISHLLEARILFNLGEEDIINQDDIDKIF